MRNRMLLPVIFFLASWPVAGQADDYTVSISRNTPRLANVVATFIPDGNEVGMNEHNEHGLPNGWATFVKNVEAIDVSGKRFQVIAKADSRWEIVDYVQGPVTFSYQVELGHDLVEPPLNGSDNGAAYANNDGVMWAGRALFIAGKPTTDISVSFDLSNGWGVTTQWEQTTSAYSFNVDVTENLVNSAFFAGTHKHREFTDGGVSLRMAFSGEYSVNVHKQIEEQLARYFNYYGQQYNSPLQANLILIVSDAGYGGGEMMGNAISLTIGPNQREGNSTGLSKDMIHVIAHEVFHSFTNNQMEIDDDGEDSSSYVWFLEGFAAEFGTYTAELRTHSLTEAEFLQIVVSKMAKYQAEADGELTLLSAGAEKFDNYQMNYAGGFMAALSLDFLIRGETNGSKSLTDLWRYLIVTYPRHGKVFTLLELYDSVQKLFGTTIAIELERYVTSPEIIPVFESAKLMGLSYDGENLFVSEDATERQKELWQGFLLR